MAEQMRFDIVGRDAGAGQVMRDLAKNSDLAATQVRRLADAEQAQRRASDASAAATLASAKADKILRDASDEAIASVVAQRIETEKLARTSKEAAGREGMGALAGLGGGGVPGGAMGGMIAAGALLSPVLVSVGTGLGGLGIAAYGVAKPIENAAQKAGGLKANMHGLDAEQRTVANSILGLGHQYSAFQRALKPEILTGFNDAIRIGGHLMHDVQPVAAATGKALDQVLLSVDKEFQSGEWQNFFGFMAKTAGPDVKMLGNLFVDLTNDLPPLIEALQPVATALLDTTDAVAKGAGIATQAFANLAHGQAQYNLAATDTSHRNGILSNSWHWLLRILNDTSLNALPSVHKQLTATAVTTDKATKATKGYTTVTYDATVASGRLGRETEVISGKEKIFAGITGQQVVGALRAQEKELNRTAAGYEHALTPLNNYISASITEANDLHALHAALRASGDAIGYKTQKERDSFAAAQTYITDTIKQGNAALSAHKGIDAQITSIERALPQLEHVKGKTADYRAELGLLKDMLDKLRKEKLIQEQLSITGTGHWAVSQSLAPGPGHRMARGGRVTGGIPGRDSVLIAAMPDEVVVPVDLVRAGAVDHLRGHIPGFAAGGVVPSYSGGPAGLPPWTSHNQQATITALTASIGNAMASAFKQQVAASSFGGGGYNASLAAEYTYAQSLFPRYGWGAGQFPFLLALWNQESGWNPNARNPSSGAAGIPQDITGNFHGGYKGQIGWGENYIFGRYGSPAGAWAHERAFNWYGNGLRGGVFTRPTVIGVGDGQPERVDVTPLGRGGGRGGALVHIENYVQQDATDVTLLGQKLSFAITAAGLGS